mmetsp:Transcript_100737/g.260249  ORF Transcript_100737/g.260249 Transcript_100737/m.260249 type:complete len:255 (+) Transcript_100737:510-1274(+)
MVLVQSIEDLLHVLVTHVELLLHDFLELVERDRASAVRVQLYEGVAHLGPLLVRQRPGHHAHASTPEAGGLRKLGQGVCDAVVDVRRARQLVPLVDPWVQQRHLGRQPLFRIEDQQLRHEVLRFLRDARPDVLLHGVSTLLDGPDLAILGAGERHVPEEDNEDGDAQAPQVTLARVVLAQDLRRHVRERAAAEGHLGVGRPDLAEAEVDELQVVAVRGVVEEVLQLDVAVHDVVAVDVVEGQQHLPGRVGTIFF